MTTAFDFQPTLKGSRVTVRPIKENDWTSMFAAAANPKVWELHPATGRYTEPVFRDFFDAAIASGAAFSFVDNESDAVIGSSRYHGLDQELSEVEIGWTFLGLDYWGDCCFLGNVIHFLWYSQDYLLAAASCSNRRAPANIPGIA